MTDRKHHPLNQSRLYKIKSPAQLADILTIKPQDIEDLIDAPENYIRFTTEDGRDIQWPKPLLRRAHKRTATLLSRIETPSFLHSAIKGKSYLTNAKPHLSNHPTVKVDIKKFFASVRAAAVFHFFKDTMLCKEDVAAVLTKLLTVDKHLPTGSSVSPILSYFAYHDMFNELKKLADENGCEMTCYVDDLTFTGPGATRKLLYQASQIIGRYRLVAHKTKIFKPGQPKIVTGVAITKHGNRVPNKRQKTIQKDLQELAEAKSEQDKIDIMTRLIGRMFEAAQLDPSWRKRAESLVAEKAGLERRLALAASTKA